MFRRSLLVPLLLATGFVDAQHSPLAGPAEGFVFDAPTQGFRVISGSLGAASLGPVLLGPYEFGAVAPGKNYAIGYKSGQCYFITGLDSVPVSAAISDGCALPEGVAWSGDGSTAVLYSQTGNWLQVVNGLSTQPVVNASISATPLGGSLSAVSSDFSGGRVFAAVTGGSAGVYQVQSDQSLLLLLPLAQPAALAVSDERQIVYALDASSGQIYELNLTDASSRSWTVADLQNPVSVALGRDAKGTAVLYVAGGADQLLAAYDVSSRAEIMTVSLDFSPTAMEPLGPHSFLLRRRISDQDALWSFTDAAAPAAYFIPATPLAVSGGLQ